MGIAKTSMDVWNTIAPVIGLGQLLNYRRLAFRAKPQPACPRTAPDPPRPAARAPLMCPVLAPRTNGTTRTAPDVSHVVSV